MKIRSGFVSNSSSSSFVLVVSTLDHVAALNKLDPSDWKLMQKVLKGIKPTTMSGTDILVITGGDWEECWGRGSLYSEDLTDEDVEQFQNVESHQDRWEAEQVLKKFWDRYVAALPQDNIVYEWEDR